VLRSREATRRAVRKFWPGSGVVRFGNPALLVQSLHHGKVVALPDAAVLELEHTEQRKHSLLQLTDPHGRSESVHLTEEGQLKAKSLAAQWFAAPRQSQEPPPFSPR